MKSRYLDLLERVVASFLAGALGTWLATDIDLFSETALKIALGAGAVSAAKCVLAFQVGSSNTAALLPAGPDTDLGGDAGHADLPHLIVIAALAVIVVTIYHLLIT